MIGLVVAVMDRNDRVLPCIETWINQPEIYEVVLVDWSSKIPIYDDPNLISIKKHPKIKIIRVKLPAR